MKNSRKTSATIPSRQDINVYDSLDELSACEHFLGKNLAEAEALFSENFLYYQEDLMWMGPRAFHYYVRAAINYLRGESSSGECVSFFAMILEFRLERERTELLPVAREIAEACRYIIEHWGRFEVDAEPHGGVFARYVALRQAFEHLKDESS